MLASIQEDDGLKEKGGILIGAIPPEQYLSWTEDGYRHTLEFGEYGWVDQSCPGLDGMDNITTYAALCIMLRGWHRYWRDPNADHSDRYIEGLDICVVVLKEYEK